MTRSSDSRSIKHTSILELGFTKTPMVEWKGKPIRKLDKEVLDGLYAVIGHIMRNPNGSETTAWFRGFKSRGVSPNEIMVNRRISLRNLRESLDILAESLDRVISKVTEVNLQVKRGTEISSLPDDAIALIMESANAQIWEDYSNEEHSLIWATQLACVCKRFRRIALHLPSLWEHVSNNLPKSAISLATRRCRNQRVFIDSFVKREFMRNIKPNSQWKELTIYYLSSVNGSTLIKQMEDLITEPFNHLMSFSILNDSGVDDAEANNPSLWSASSDHIVSSWDLTRLLSLQIDKAIPSRLRVSNLKQCCIDLQWPETRQQPFAWDMQALHNLFHSFGSIEILKIFISNASSSVSIVTGELALLANLAEFTLQLGPKVEQIVVYQIMEICDMPNLRRWDTLMKYRNQRGTEPPISEWLWALFHLPSGKGRVFPNLEEFCFEVQDLEGIKLPYKRMLLAMPKLRHMSLSLPGCAAIPLKTAHRLRDLRTLRLNNCTSFDNATLGLRSFLMPLEHFEKLEVTGHSRLNESYFRNYVRSRKDFKLAWNAEKIKNRDDY